MDLSQVAVLLSVLLGVSVILNLVQLNAISSVKKDSLDSLNALRTRCTELEGSVHKSELGRQADRIRFENEQHELLKAEKTKAYEEGRELGRVAQRKEHIEELTQLHQQCSKKVSEEVEKAVAETRDKVRTEYELQSKMFSVQISPFVEIIEDKGLIRSTYSSEVGYQYQLLVNGIPVFQPHVIAERSEVRKEISPEKVKELALLATEMATKAIDTYLGGSGQAFGKLAPLIVKQITGR
jgi:hypothetical protein